MITMDRWTIYMIGLYLLAVDYVVMVFPADTDDRWSSWSAWSECSRTCDGGASYQLRTCHDDQGACAGSSIRYKTCNNQICPLGDIDFRTQQCQAYNDVKYKNKLYKWQPFYDVANPCSLQCTALDGGLRVMLAPKVLDGTRCYQNGRDMCINGICRVVGCDHVLGSTLREDKCGVCGGDDTSCLSRRLPVKNGDKQSPHFVWKYTDFSPCTVSCGVGEQTSKPVCVNIRTENVVYPLYCDHKTRPPPQMRTCTEHSCQPTWITAEWQPCSRSCGGGLTTRNVYCVTVLLNGSFTRTGKQCSDKKPSTQKPCNIFTCPVWMAGDWAPCSVTCGKGVQSREVICRPTKEHDCILDDMPKSTQRCHTGVDCIRPQEHERNLISLPSTEQTTSTIRPIIRKIDNRPKELRPPVYGQGSQYYEQALPGEFNQEGDGTTPGDGTRPGDEIRPLFFKEAKELMFVPPLRPETEALEYGAGFGSDDGSGQVLGELEAQYDARGILGVPADTLEAFMGPPAALTGETARKTTVSTTPSFVVSNWSSCSATCGTGLRNRRVACQVYLEFAETVQTLIDSECSDPKPSDIEICKLSSCHHISPLERDVYIWSFTGYGPCNATCIGGYKNATFSCKRVKDFATVTSHYCHHIHLPDMDPQQCNVIPCAAEWQTTPAGPCSALCGGGYQILRRLCIRRFGWGRNDIQIVKPQHCEHTEQPDRKIVCNTHHCPPSWRVGPWSKCSKTCGNSSQSRTVVCEKRLGRGLSEVLSQESLCIGNKPPIMRYCDMPRCPGRTYKEHILQDNSWFVQLRPLPRVYIDVGGRATVLPRTTIKIRCPVRKISRRQIVWKHNGVDVAMKGRIRRSRKGVLLVRKSRTSDSGVYTCVAGNARANITVSFHSASDAAEKLADRAYLISRLGSFHNQVRITNSRASLLAIKKQFRHLSALPFHYVTTDWSVCSKSCGGAGLQSRRITCDLVFPNYYFMVRDDFCNNRGQEQPVDSRDCGYQKCPHWEMSDWSECSDRHCVRNKYGARLRNLMCVAHDSSMVPLTQCDGAMRPNDTMPCPADRCYARWQTSLWSRCSKTCGGSGVKTRALSCIWSLTGKPAGANCRRIKRPELVKQCHSPKTCNNGCRDKSKYCSLIPRLNFCRFKQYSEDCCASCADYEEIQERQRLRRVMRVY